MIDIATSAAHSTALSQLASQSGGEYFAVDRQRVLDQVAKIVIAMRNMYYLGYTPRGNASSHNVQVSINTPRGLPPLTVRPHQGHIETAR